MIFILCVFTARVITDRDSGRSRGFGFVNFATGEAASSALSSMDGQVGKACHIFLHVNAELL